jgi:demethylmenaquinone methyltransferase/2-methoxy-6-polyprenyl-1,4-benzoquinol methylase
MAPAGLATARMIGGPGPDRGIDLVSTARNSFARNAGRSAHADSERVQSMSSVHRAGTTEEVRDYYALNARVWPKLAPFYDAIVRPIRRMRRRVVEVSGAAPGTRVLDVATGTGEQAFAFVEAGAKVIGVDISEAMLRIARRKDEGSNIDFRQADATQLPFADASFDIASIAFGLHEMPPIIRSEALREMARVTRSGGRLIVFDYALPHNPLWRSLVYRVVKSYERDHYTDFVAIDLGALLETCGFDIGLDEPALLGSARIVMAAKSGRGPAQS